MPTRSRITGCWSWAVIALLVFPGVAVAQCPVSSAPVTNPHIAKRWMELCDEAGKDVMGAALGPTRIHLGSSGYYQDFEFGQIAVHPRWAGNPAAKMPDFVISAYDMQGDSKIHVRWGSTAPYEYDHFLVRWDLDDHAEAIVEQHALVGDFLGIGGRDRQQIEVEGFNYGGSAVIQAVGNPGTQIIYVEGCDDDDECPEGWSFPVEVDLGNGGPNFAYRGHFFKWSTKPTLPLPPSLNPSDSPPFDLLDGPVLGQPWTKEVVENLCVNPQDMIESDDSEHAGELITAKAEAVLFALLNPNISCPRLVVEDGKPIVTNYTPDQLRQILNEKILQAKVSSIPGTDLGQEGRIWLGVGFVLVGGLLGALFGFLSGPMGPIAGALLGSAIVAILEISSPLPPGDYDMRLQGLLRIAYRGEAFWGHPNNLERILHDKTRAHLRDVLLTVNGGADQRRESLYLYGIPTGIPESENHILMTESARFLTNQLIARHYQEIGEPVPKEYDNDQNGMTEWFLAHLRSFVVNDFHEYNARPYSREAMEGISNLFEFAGPLQGCWRSNPSTQPPSPPSCDVRRGARIVMDYLAAKFAVSSLGLRRAPPYRRQPPQRDYSRLMGRHSDPMTWRYLALTGGDHIFWDHRHGRLATNFAGSLLLPISGRYRLPSMIAHMIYENNDSYYQRFYFNRGEHPGVEIYYRHADYLISAGGVHDQGRMGWISDAEDAWARPTILMPERAGLDYRDFIRIAGHAYEEERANICVGPEFACGLNPMVPTGIPEACMRRDGDWLFLDFNKNLPGCELDFGYYVVFYRQRCDTSECRDQAGDDGSFGFFHVTNHRIGLEELRQDTLAANKGATFRSAEESKYHAADGRIFTFVPSPKDVFTEGFISIQQGSYVAAYDTDSRKWPLVTGGRLRSVEPEGCIEIDNPLVDQRLILDFTDVKRPKRTRLKLSTIGRNCKCPLPEECLPPRYE